MKNLRSPVEFYSVKPNGTDVRKITQINSDKLAAVRMGEYEQFTFAGWNNETVYCYVVKPVDFDPEKKYPVAFLIHGGPQGSFGNMFHYRWNPQAYAGAGYAAVMVDFHGSTGYGQAFTDSIRGDWGGKPLVDLQKGCPFVPRCMYAVEQCLEEMPPLEQTDGKDHTVACWRWEYVAGKVTADGR